MIVPLISIVWSAALVALVAWLATHREHGTRIAAQRSPSLLRSGRPTFEQAIGEMLRATPAAAGSKPATAEHVRDGAQEDLYVRP
jgi:cytochrome P450